MRRTILHLCLLCFLWYGSTAHAQHEVSYTIDPAKSQFTVYAYRGGLFGRFGHDHTIAVLSFKGTVRVTEGAIIPASLNLVVQAASLKPVDKISDADRSKIETTMRQEVLEITRYPEIRFQSIAVALDAQKTPERDAIIIGMIDLHGVSRLIVIEARVAVKGATLRATGAFTLDQKDFGIRPVSVFGGAVKVRDELRLTFDLVALRSPG